MTHSIDRYLHNPSNLILTQNAIPLDFRRFSDANRDSYIQQRSSIQLRNWNVTIKSQIGNDRLSTFGCKQRVTEPEVMNDSFQSYLRFRWVKNDSGNVIFFRSFLFFIILCLFVLFFSKDTPRSVCYCSKDSVLACFQFHLFRLVFIVALDATGLWEWIDSDEFFGEENWWKDLLYGSELFHCAAGVPLRADLWVISNECSV